MVKPNTVQRVQVKAAGYSKGRPLKTVALMKLPHADVTNGPSNGELSSSKSQLGTDNRIFKGRKVVLIGAPAVPVKKQVKVVQLMPMSHR